MPGFHTNHTEDVQTAQWLRNLDPATDPIRSADLGRAMMSWKDENLGIETVAIRKPDPHSLYLPSHSLSGLGHLAMNCTSNGQTV